MKRGNESVKWVRTRKEFFGRTDGTDSTDWLALKREREGVTQKALKSRKGES